MSRSELSLALFAEHRQSLRFQGRGKLHLLAAGVHRLVDHALAHEERTDLGVRSGMLVVALPAHKEVPRQHV